MASGRGPDPDTLADAKARAARSAADLVRSGMVVGLGSGTTAAHAVRRLAERIRAEGLVLRGIPTSLATAALARERGVPLVSFDEVTAVDLTIDGADEVDPALDLIKGHGGALLREKVVASRSRQMIVVVDDTKLVARLGIGRSLPVEVVPFAWRPVAEELARLGGAAELRRAGGGDPYVTDNHNWVLDLRLDGGIADAAALERAIDAIPGVVESGLFVGLAHRVIAATAAGLRTLER